MTTDSALATRLGQVHTALLCDVLDSLGFREAALGASIQAVAGGSSLVGRAYPLRCEAADRVPDAPYERLIDAFDHLTGGDVIVIATGDDVSAMWGELLSTAAAASGVLGAVMDGLVRDLDDIDEMGFPVFGTGVSPLDSAGRQDVVEHGAPIRCGDAPVRRGDWIVADRMGVVVVPAHLALEATDRAEKKMAGESTARAELAAGESLGVVFDRHGIL